MAYTQGNKQWTAPFKSLNGTACRIDIYKKGYTGSFVYDLKAADKPFFYEEGDSDDLLNDVLRYRTGYIRLTEEITGFLEGIYPSEFFDRYVEVYYGTALVFNGYIQVQEFSNAQVPATRVREFPVISPLGLAQNKVFSNIMPPRSISLGELLNQAAAGYDYVYFPDRYGYPDPVYMGMTIYSLVMSPWNADYHHSMNVGAGSKVMKGETHAFLIESICKAFGWICHDTPTALIFTAYDYEDTYCRFPVGHIGESGYSESVSVSASAVTLTDYFSNADDTANIKTLEPETGIEIKYEGDEATHELSFDRTYIPQTDPIVTMPSEASTPNERNSLCTLLPTTQTYEFSSNLRGLSFNSSDKIESGQGCCAWNGREGIMVSLSDSYSSGRELFKIRFYIKRRAGQSYRFSYNMIGKQNGAIMALAIYESDVDDYYITYSASTANDDYIEVTFIYRYDSNSHPILPSNTLIFISDIKLTVYEDGEPYADYRYITSKDRDLIPDTYDPQPAVSSSVEMPISLYRIGDTLIGSTARSTKLTTYPYLFQPRKEYTGRFRLVTYPTYPHIMLFSYLDKKWRIIAQRFDPWNDEVTLTMQHSPVL